MSTFTITDVIVNNSFLTPQLIFTTKVEYSYQYQIPMEILGFLVAAYMIYAMVISFMNLIAKKIIYGQP